MTGRFKSIATAALVASSFLTTAPAGAAEAPQTGSGKAELELNLPEGLPANPSLSPSLAQLRREPCDQTAIFDLSDKLEVLGWRREAANVLLVFSKHCDGVPRALRVAVNILLKLSDYKKAVEVADALIEMEPYRDNGYYLRGLANERQRQFDKAIPDYITAIELFGNKSAISSVGYMNLSNVYAALGRFCDAVLPVEAWVAVNPAKNDTSQTRAMISDLWAKGRCASASTAASESIPIARANNVITVAAAINGKRGRFVLDTGASYVALKESFATKAGVTVQEDGTVRLSTANGVTTGKLGRADLVQLGKVQATNVALVVQPDRAGTYGTGIDGLLGMSFLSRFDLTMNAKTVTLRARNSQSAQR